MRAFWRSAADDREQPHLLLLPSYGADGAVLYYLATHPAVLTRTSSMDTMTLLQEVIKHHGFSVHDYRGRHGQEPPQFGYMVALPGYEESFPLQEVEARPDLFDAYADANEEPLSGPNRFFGAWVYKGWVYFDIAEFVPDREEAIRLGHEYAQESIYNLSTGDVLSMRDYP